MTFPTLHQRIMTLERFEINEKKYEKEVFFHLPPTGDPSNRVTSSLISGHIQESKLFSLSASADKKKSLNLVN